MEDTNEPCPQCVIKHLCMAFSLLAEQTCDRTVKPTYNDVKLARAWILANEAESGYPTHALIAAGLLARLEMEYPGDSPEREKIRSVRMRMMNGEPEALKDVRFLSMGEKSDMEDALAVAHLYEAEREAPQAITFPPCIRGGNKMTARYRDMVEAIPQLIDQIRKEYFDDNV